MLADGQEDDAIARSDHMRRAGDRRRTRARAGRGGNPFVATAPAVSDGLALVPMGNTLVAVTIATGREAWRGPRTAQSATVAAGSGMAFVLGEDERFHALDAATGRETWAVPFPARGSCTSVPVASAGSVLVSRNVLVKAADASQPASYARHLVALDANTGEERWRYPATSAGKSTSARARPSWRVTPTSPSAA